MDWFEGTTGDHGSLRRRNDRSEKVENRGQIFTILRCIVVLFAEKSGKYGPILRFRSRSISAAQAPRLTRWIFSYKMSPSSVIHLVGKEGIYGFKRKSNRHTHQ